MNNFLFENGTRFLFGGGCVKEYLASFLRKYGPSILLVTEEGERRSGAADEVRDILRRSGKQAAECFAGPFCPRYEQVQQAARLCRERHVDLILGVGGSAVLDGCKAASLAAVCRGDLWENFGQLQGVVDVPPLPVGFVASHLEVGAVNGAAGLLHENQCVWRDYPPCDPRFALLDPARTGELPRRELLFQGFSALAGALEQYLTLMDGMSVSRELLEALLEGMVRDLRVCRQTPGDENARSSLMCGAPCGGAGFFQLGRRFSFPALPVPGGGHSVRVGLGGIRGGAGRSSAVPLPPGGGAPSRGYGPDGCRLWGLPGQGRTEAQPASGGVRTLEGFTEELGLPVRPEQLGAAVRNRLEQRSTSQNLLVHTV